MVHNGLNGSFSKCLKLAEKSMWIKTCCKLVIKIWSDHNNGQQLLTVHNTVNETFSCFTWTYHVTWHSGKRKWTLDIITGWPSFDSCNLHKPFPVIVDQTTRDFAPFLFIILFLWRQAVNRSLEVTPNHPNQVEVRASPGHQQKANFTSVEAILLLISSCAVSVCPIASPNICWASIGGQMALRSPAKCPDKRGNSFFCRW